MSSSDQTPNDPKNLTAPKRRVLRRALTPPEQNQPVSPHLLLPDDDDAAFVSLRNRALRLSGDNQDFAAFLGDVLSTNAWEHRRLEFLRAAAINLQIEDDRPDTDSEFAEIDGPTRQYLSYAKLAAQQPFRYAGTESDRYFRRIRQTMDSILKAATRRLR